MCLRPGSHLARPRPQGPRSLSPSLAAPIPGARPGPGTERQWAEGRRVGGRGQRAEAQRELPARAPGLVMRPRGVGLARPRRQAASPPARGALCARPGALSRVVGKPRAPSNGSSRSCRRAEVGTGSAARAGPPHLLARRPDATPGARTAHALGNLEPPKPASPGAGVGVQRLPGRPGPFPAPLPSPPFRAPQATGDEGSSCTCLIRALVSFKRFFLLARDGKY